VSKLEGLQKSRLLLHFDAARIADADRAVGLLRAVVTRDLGEAYTLLGKLSSLLGSSTSSSSDSAAHATVCRNLQMYGACIVW
jgi:hypothetical protein